MDIYKADTEFNQFLKSEGARVSWQNCNRQVHAVHPSALLVQHNTFCKLQKAAKYYYKKKLSIISIPKNC